MVREEKTATATTAYGENLEKPITFSYSFDAFERYDEIPAEELPTPKQIVAWANAQRNASERSKAQNAAFSEAGIQKPTLESPDVRLKNMVKILVANGNSAEDAEKMARQVLGL